MRKEIFIFIFTFVLIGAGLLASPTVFAVGGGGGGSVPSCNADNWDCTGWSQCGSNGTQTRICSLTYDCPTVSTPKPSESQSCTPPAPKPSAKPQPQQTEPKTPSCTKDTWTCSTWSQSCDIYGREQRTCQLSFDCPNIETPPPPESQACEKLQCGNKSTLRDRVSCRLNLAPAGAARDLEIQYLPEACRVKTGAEQKECVGRYKSFQPCWNAKEGDERFSCARNVLKLGPLVSDEVKTCQGKKGRDQVACKIALKEKVLYMIAFRFYDLETRAEELGNRGADLNAIADFETIVELKKQAFDKASINAERRQIILDVRKAWQEFISKVKDQIK
ncbi:hypothetical protein COU01_01800 [Candidatus Falkowbacteria bacterium CG10_big_fil_rev_8_21_14_0_10_44_15]|uniref:Uncharacterized protein n=1 Tax=Candidatus Falkowbacteria bacterium CG10_big_fil_rev_8_21_14_0_10_44_15 TaxID=1974569 RepID=A0A2H0V037_9BACT|nr:MAG: hypothetical protein COU01_01800 [Candidatus Falkowbacteria bacterium CG10_big_fil_rev_8_21_14_0_10_44_15]